MTTETRITDKAGKAALHDVQPTDTDRVVYRWVAQLQAERDADPGGRREAAHVAGAKLAAAQCMDLLAGALGIDTDTVAYHQMTFAELVAEVTGASPARLRWLASTERQRAWQAVLDEVEGTPDLDEVPQ